MSDAENAGLKGESDVEHIRRENPFNVPNLLTVLRMAMLPAIVWRYRLGDARGALAVYLLAMLTDAADGFIARRFHQITALGKLLDPIADKLSLLTLLGLFVADGQIPLWLMAVVLLKEAILIAGGVAALREGIVVYALPIGKVTTVSFILSMIARFLAMRKMADLLLGVSVALSMAALVWYAAALLRQLYRR
ncbi:MAG: CDP-alcohol phosphatidyltransferase family protein [Candidatus Ventricola sp.]